MVSRGWRIRYRVPTSVLQKGQVVADFVAELTTSVLQKETPKPKLWKIYVDESSNHEAGGVGVVIEIHEEE